MNSQTEGSTVAAGVQPRAVSSSARLPWIDAIRAGGAFLVVLAHVVLYPALRGSGPLWAEAVYYTATRVAVPLFFMVSGYLLLGKDEGYGDFFRKRALRVFIPFLIWSFIYLAWNGGFSGAPLSVSAILDGLLRILRGPRAAHLWFFYVLIALYLFTPILRIFTLHARPRDLLYFCCLWLFLDPVLSLVQHLTSVQIGFEFLFVTGYIGYYVLGHYLGHVAVTRRTVWIAAAVLLAAYLFVLFTVYEGLQSPIYDQFYEGYLSLPVVLMTASAFLIVRSLNGEIGPRALRWIAPLSRASLGIYLLHVIVLYTAAAYLGPKLPFLATGSTILMMPLVGIAGFVACYLVIAALQRLPIIRYAVP